MVTKTKQNKKVSIFKVARQQVLHNAVVRDEAYFS